MIVMTFRPYWRAMGRKQIVRRRLLAPASRGYVRGDAVQVSQA